MTCDRYVLNVETNAFIENKFGLFQDTILNLFIFPLQLGLQEATVKKVPRLSPYRSVRIIINITTF